MRIDDRDHIGRKLDTLVQCALHRRAVRLTCKRCSHSQLFDAVPLWWMFDRRGWSGVFPEVRRQFYCGPCWEKDRRKVRPAILVTDEPPPQTGRYPYPDERTWKRLVSRYRS